MEKDINILFQVGHYSRRTNKFSNIIQLIEIDLTLR